MTSRPSTAAPILAVLAVGLVTLGIYVGGYLWLPDVVFGEADGKPSCIERVFPMEWQARLFGPVAPVERSLRQRNVIISTVERGTIRLETFP